MGYNATVVVNMDTVHFAPRLPNFGAGFEDACLKHGIGDGPPVHYECISVIEMHHSNYLVPVIVGANSGMAIMESMVGFDPNQPEHDNKVRVLKEMARALGYRVSKINKK